MSQAKVDRYKEEKRNREQIIKKQKRDWMLVKAGISALIIVVVGWLGMAVYETVTAPEPITAENMETYIVDTTAIDEYLYDLSSAE